MTACHCGDDDCWHFPGYPWCRPCEEHHRAPECPVDEQGRSLAPCGHPWDGDPCTELATTPSPEREEKETQ